MLPILSFNPHARVGRDKISNKMTSLFYSFNPHARVGRDPFEFWEKRIFHCFNPHARVGRDERDSKRPNPIGVSIHTPVWGVTFYNEFSTKERVFQSTRPCGA